MLRLFLGVREQNTKVLNQMTKASGDPAGGKKENPGLIFCATLAAAPAAISFPSDMAKSARRTGNWGRAADDDEGDLKSEWRRRKKLIHRRLHCKGVVWTDLHWTRSV